MKGDADIQVDGDADLEVGKNLRANVSRQVEINSDKHVILLLKETLHLEGGNLSQYQIKKQNSYPVKVHYKNQRKSKHWCRR